MHSICIQADPLNDDPNNDKAFLADNDTWFLSKFDGHAHEYFHHYQNAHVRPREMAMAAECCGLHDPLGAPAWYVEGTARKRWRASNAHEALAALGEHELAAQHAACGPTLPIGAAPRLPTRYRYVIRLSLSTEIFPTLFFHEFFDDIPYIQRRGLNRGRRWGDQASADTVYWIALSLEEWWGQAKREFFNGTGTDGVNPECYTRGGVTADEELRHSSKCDAMMMNWYLAYITSLQVVLVSMLRDMHDLGFDGAFIKHVGMTKESFYEQYNAFMFNGTEEDPPPPGFFPLANQSVYELVNFTNPPLSLPPSPQLQPSLPPPPLPPLEPSSSPSADESATLAIALGASGGAGLLAAAGVAYYVRCGGTASGSTKSPEPVVV